MPLESLACPNCGGDVPQEIKRGKLFKCDHCGHALVWPERQATLVQGAPLELVHHRIARWRWALEQRRRQLVQLRLHRSGDGRLESCDAFENRQSLEVIGAQEIPYLPPGLVGPVHHLVM